MKNLTKLGLWPSVAIVLGCIIGSGIFVKSSDLIAISQNTSYAIFAWVIGGLIALASGLTLAEVAYRYPKTGGVYIYIECIYGKTLGFIAGWVQSFIFAPTFFAALNLYFSEIFCSFFNLDSFWKIPVALSCLISLAIINILGTKYASILQDITALTKVIPLAVIGIGGIFFGTYPFWNVTLESATLPSNFFGLLATFSSTILFTLWAYEGWVNISYVTEEIDRPSINIPLAITIGVLLSMTIYIIFTISMIKIIGADQFAALKDKGIMLAATTLIGPIFAKLITPGILASIYGTINGQTMTTTRITYAMANSDVFPLKNKFASLHPKFMTPAFSIMVNTLLASIMICFSNPSKISDISITVIYMIYGMVFLGIFKVRKLFGVPGKENYKIPLYPLTPILVILGCVLICYSIIKEHPTDLFIALLLSLAGMPVYLFLKYKNKTGNSTK